MATELQDRPADAPAAPTPAAKHENFIQQQLALTRVHVKVVDLVSGLMVLLAAAVAFLLLLVLVDHWIWPLGRMMRFAALGTLLAGGGWYFLRTVWPLITRRINPVYAARTLEESDPSFKNSLVNFVLLRSSGQPLHRAVFSAVESRAAADLSRIKVETAVDHSKLIRIGCVLIAVLVVGAVYKFVSPKDPFTSVARVAAPWAGIQRPTRVAIEDVLPGDAEIFHGQSLTVSCRVLGIGDDDPVRLIYQTADGQVIDRAVPMRLASDGIRREVTLPADDQGRHDPRGIQQSLTYRLEAGDAVSPDFQVHVVPAPTILVRRVEYEFPRYTNRARELREQQGDVRALEGTRVRIVAEANQPIRSASIEFDPQSDASSTLVENALPLKVDGKLATGTFVLRLQADRKTPENNSYQVRFVNQQRQRSAQPIRHRIEVIPDLAPEVAILQPTRKEIEVPEDGAQTIEIRALDPDYGLTRIGLKALAGDSELFDQELLRATGQQGQAVASYTFKPQEHGLVAGDRITYWSVAEDNRQGAGNEPQPNRQRTDRYRIKIVPGRQAQTKPGESPSNDPSDQPDKQEGDEGEGDAGSESGGGKQAGETGTEPGEDSAMGDTPGSGGEGDMPKAGDPPPGQEAGKEPGESGTAGDSGEPQEPAGDAQGMGGGSSDKPDKSDQPSDGGGGGGGEEKPGGGEGQGGPQSARREPLHDGEVFEKIEQHRKRQQANDSPGTGQQGTDPGEPSDGSPEGSDTRPAGPDAKSPGESEAGEPDGSAGESPMSGSDGQAEDLNTKDQPNPSGGAGEGTQPGTAPKPMDADAQGPPTDSPPPSEVGETGDSRGQPSRKSDTPNPKPDQDPKGPSQGGMGDNGDSGAGRERKSNQGSAEAQGENKDRDKKENPPGDERSDPSKPEPQSPSISRKQNDSRGGKSGDRSGGGEQGPGQSANQEGNDSAGNNSPADEGAAGSKQSGEGETSDQAGSKEKSDRETGNPGSTPGSGSKRKPGERGSDSGESPEDATGEPGDKPSSGSQTGDHGQKLPRGVPQGGGLGGNDPDAPPQEDVPVPDGEEANLEYAKKATDLALEYLEKTQDQPDQKLLDELGWTPEELQRFLQRWKNMKRSAATGSENQRELDQSLRSLGLRPQQRQIQRGEKRNDQASGLREAGTSSQPPAKYRDLFHSYRKGASRAANRD